MKTTTRTPCPKCGDMVRDQASHWVIAGHHRDPNITARSVRFPLDENERIKAAR